MVALFAVLCACSKPPGKSPDGASHAAAHPDSLPRITMFYAFPEHPSKDEKTLLCYGVENADSVRLEPAIDRVWPTPSRCLEAPGTQATYTLVATRGSAQVSQSINVVPGPLKAHLIEVVISKLEIAPGEELTVCYKAKNAATVIVKPGFWAGRHNPESGCIIHAPHESTTYTITATGAGGDTDSERVTAIVKSGALGNRP
jgi:hypothetical protein